MRTYSDNGLWEGVGRRRPASGLTRHILSHYGRHCSRPETAAKRAQSKQHRIQPTRRRTWQRIRYKERDTSETNRRGEEREKESGESSRARVDKRGEV